jgi:hypothetical protein
MKLCKAEKEESGRNKNTISREVKLNLDVTSLNEYICSE